MNPDDSDPAPRELPLVRRCADGTPLRIALVESRPMERMALSHMVLLALLGGTAECPHTRAAEVLAWMVEVRPDAIILACEMEGSPEFALLRKLRRIMPGVPILARLRLEKREAVHAALDAGACAIIFEHESVGVHRETLRTMLNGSVSLSPGTQAVLASGGLRRSGPAALRDLDHLTEREREIYLDLGEGRRPRAIAERAGISHKTVHAHIGRIGDKIGVHGIEAVSARAIQTRCSEPRNTAKKTAREIRKPKVRKPKVKPKRQHPAKSKGKPKPAKRPPPPSRGSTRRGR